MNDIELLDTAKKSFGFDTDSDQDFADYLDVDQSTISGIRTGKAGMSIGLRLKLMDKRGFQMASSLVESITPEHIAERIRKFNYNNAKKIARDNRAKKIKSKPPQEVSTNKKLLSFLLETNNCDSPSSLSSVWEIPNPIIKKLELDQDLLLAEHLKIVEALFKKDPGIWPMSINGISEYCATSQQLLTKLESIAASVFLDKFKQIADLKSDKDLAEFLGVSKQHVSAIKKDPSKLGAPTSLKILLELMTKSPDKTFDPEVLKLPTGKNEDFAKYINDNTKKESTNEKPDRGTPQ